LATFEVLDAQVGKYDDLPKDVAGLSDFSFHSKFADLAGMIHFNDKNEEIFAFGKYKGQVVKDVFQKD
jgi:DNA polymerase-3 subunit epsilon